MSTREKTACFYSIQKNYLDVHFVPGNSLEDFEFVAFHIQAEEIHLGSVHCQQDRIERETLSRHGINRLGRTIIALCFIGLQDLSNYSVSIESNLRQFIFFLKKEIIFKFEKFWCTWVGYISPLRQTGRDQALRLLSSNCL